MTSNRTTPVNCNYCSCVLHLFGTYFQAKLAVLGGGAIFRCKWFIIKPNAFLVPGFGLNGSILQLHLVFVDRLYVKMGKFQVRCVLFFGNFPCYIALLSLTVGVKDYLSM